MARQLLLIEHYVAPSPVHGLGVFAVNFVSKGTKVWVVHPVIDRVIPISDLKGLPNHVVKRVEMHGEFLPHLDSFRLGFDGAQFLNHCDEPDLVDRGDEMFATRDIIAGEELYCDYRQTLVMAFDPETGVRHKLPILRRA